MVLNIFSNFIPHKLIACDNKDTLLFNTKLNLSTHEKIKTHKVHHKNIKNNSQIEKLKGLQNSLKYVIDDSKYNYYLRLANKFLMNKGTQNLTDQH